MISVGVHNKIYILDFLLYSEELESGYGLLLISLLKGQNKRAITLQSYKSTLLDVPTNHHDSVQQSKLLIWSIIYSCFCCWNLPCTLFS